MKQTQDLKEALINFHLPRWHDLPDFDIYMDQVIYYINRQLEPLFISDTDKPITSSMVNNYVKNSIVKPPIKKHYKRYHLAFLIVVMILKRVYSLTEISKMIKLQTKMKDSNLEAAYDTFAIYFEQALHDILTTGEFKVSVDDNNPYRVLLMNIVQSVVLKIYAQVELIDPIV